MCYFHTFITFYLVLLPRIYVILPQNGLNKNKSITYPILTSLKQAFNVSLDFHNRPKSHKLPKTVNTYLSSDNIAANTFLSSDNVAGLEVINLSLFSNSK